MEIIKNIILTPIVFVAAFIIAIFIALFDLFRFPIEMLEDLWG